MSGPSMFSGYKKGVHIGIGAGIPLTLAAITAGIVFNTVLNMKKTHQENRLKQLRGEKAPQTPVPF